MIRVSVSALDNWRYFIENDFKSTEEYIGELCRLTPQSPAMIQGEDFHYLLQTGEPKLYTWEVTCDAALLQPDLIEYPCRETFTLDGEKVVLSGRIDAAHGDIVIDYKTTSRAINLEQYVDKWQWRAYLMLMDMSKFRYDVFQYRINRKHGKGSFTVFDYRTLNLSAYKRMTDDVMGALREYVQFLRGLKRSEWIEFDDRGYARAGRRYIAEGMKSKSA